MSSLSEDRTNAHDAKTYKVKAYIERKVVHRAHLSNSYTLNIRIKQDIIT